MKQEHVRYAATFLGFTIPPPHLESVQITPGFETMTRNSLIELESDIKVTSDAMKLLQHVYNAAETGQVSCTNSFQGRNYLQAGISRGRQCQFVYEKLFSHGNQRPRRGKCMTVMLSKTCERGTKTIRTKKRRTSEFRGSAFLDETCQKGST